MQNNNLVVSFPMDTRTGSSRNDLLDGRNHEIEVDQISTFNLGNQQFYLVDGFDITRSCDIEIVLIRIGNVLIKVPLLDYGELDRYNINLITLSDSETQNLLERNGRYISSMPITTISNIIEQNKYVQNKRNGTMASASSTPRKQRIIVFNDDDGRKFILSSAAESIGLSKPRTIKYLPLKNLDDLIKNQGIYGLDWYRLLKEPEYEWIRNNFGIRQEQIGNVDVIKYQDSYFVRRHILENNNLGFAHAFYDFGDRFFDCVPINNLQKSIIDSYYVTDYHIKNRIVRITGDQTQLTPESWSEKANKSSSKK